MQEGSMTSTSIDRLEQKVRELDATTCYLHTILEHIGQGMLFINASGTVIGYNHAAQEILKQPAVDVLFCHYAEYFADEGFGFSLQAALKTHTVPKESMLVKQRESQIEQALEVHASWVAHEMAYVPPSTRAEDLDFTEGILLLFCDVTRRELERQQEERSLRLRQLGEMAASIAHEIRNPLGGIKGFASILERDLASQPHLQKMANYIIEGASHLNRLIDTMLHYARPLKPTLQPIDLVVFLLDFIYHVRMDSALQAVEYSVNLTEGSLYVEMDTGLFHAALLNLITNSVQAMPQGGNITIELQREENDAVVVISDTGEGISKENLEKIFQPFFTTKPAGSGFGLSETLKIIQAHHGSIKVESKLGEGSSFRLLLPVTARREERI